MKTLSPGKFEITIGGETKEIIISLGLKTELYKLITRAQLSLAALQQKVFMDEAIAEEIQKKDKEINELKEAEVDEITITNAEEELDALYGKALADIEQRQSKALDETVMSKIDMSERTLAEAIACLLSKRDEVGKITEQLEPDVIMWSPVYAEAQEELTELLHAVTEYITSALKKISGINKMVTEVTQEANQKESPQE
jgi:hypothetical protein